MPKQKSHRASGKRLKRTGTGKIKRPGIGRGHLLTNKSRKRKRNLRKGGVLAKADTKRLLDRLPK